MWLEPQPTEVLSVVVGMFERFGASPQTLFDLEETITDRQRQAHCPNLSSGGADGDVVDRHWDRPILRCRWQHAGDRQPP